MIRPQVPRDVTRGVQTRWPDRGSRWVERVEAELADLCARYRATPRKVLPARYGFVVAVDTPDGGLVMRASPDPDGPVQARVAGALADLGVSPTLHETIVTDTGTWTVLDEVRPGRPLPQVHPSTVTLDALVAPLVAMADRPAPVPGMRWLIDWLRERLEDDDPADLPPTATVAPASERRDALQILDKLSTGSVAGLCHGDASPWNYLASTDRRWVLIDPRGISGEAEYDLAVLGLKVAWHCPADTYVCHLSRTSAIDVQRIMVWMTVARAARV